MEDETGTKSESQMKLWEVFIIFLSPIIVWIFSDFWWALLVFIVLLLTVGNNHLIRERDARESNES